MFLAGAGRVAITPPLETPCGGFGEWDPKPFTGIARDTYVRALVLQDGSAPPIAIISVEATESNEYVVQRVRDEVERQTKIPARNTFVAMTHTHCAPNLMRPASPYVHLVQQKIVDAVVVAQQHLRPAVLKFSTRRISGPATNRRIVLKNGRVWPRFFVGPEIPTRETAKQIFSNLNYGPNVDYRSIPLAEEIVGPGPANPNLTVMTLVDQEQGETIACVAHYACHATAALESRNVHGDFPGFACSKVEEVVGGICLFLAGASGNINCNAFLRERTDAEAERLGLKFSEEILTALASSSEVTEPQLGVRSARIWLPLREEMKPEFNRESRRLLEGRPNEEGSLRELDRIAGEIRILENLVKDGALPPVTQEGKISTEISAVHLGPNTLITIPGELFVEIGTRIAQLSPFGQTLVVTHCNGGVGYIPELAAFGQGGYEDSPAYCSFVGPESEERIMAVCRELLASA